VTFSHNDEMSTWCKQDQEPLEQMIMNIIIIIIVVVFLLIFVPTVCTNKAEFTSQTCSKVYGTFG